MKDKVVLAFSGGLDTSYCAVYLAKALHLEVYTAIVNTGGFSKQELKSTAKKARHLGVKNHVSLDRTDEFYQKCIRYLVFGNILKNNTYPLSVSAERVFQALAIVQYAREVGARYIAHGSTGAGNDQVRFDLVFQVLAPEMEILTPIRDQRLSRQEEISYLADHGFPLSWEKAQYSINKGLWGTSVGGAETLTSEKPLPEEAFPTPVSEHNAKEIAIGFEAGELVQVGEKVYENPVEAILQLSEIASPYGIGRDIHIGDTIIGIKGRVGFEAAAPLIIIKAHHALEKHILTKWQQYWKEQLANWYGMLLHEGQYLEPVMRNIERFLEDTQQYISGKVFIKLSPYRFEIQGIHSDHDLMASKFGQYGEMNEGWSGEDVKGFTKIFANQTKIHHLVHNHD